MEARHGGKILVDQLKIQGVDRVFCIPGESYLAALDGLYESGIDTVICRQESGASMMADAHARMTGKVGIAFVTRGPGATNASAGVHIAMQDSVPMILFIGQIGRSMRDREAFQEVDYRQMYGPLCKWVAEIDQTERIPEYVSHAFHMARSGRPGPVVIALPEDMLSAEAEVEDARPAVAVEAKAAEEDVARIAAMLDGAQRPLVIAGGGGWTPETAKDIEKFAEHFDLPITVSFRCQDFMDNRHPNYVGDVGISPNPKLAARVREADLLLVLGARLGEMTTGGYTLFSIPNPKQTMIHAYPGSDELGRVYRPDVAINASMPSLVAKLAALPARNDIAWRERTRLARTEYEAWTEPEETPGAVKLEQVVCHLRDTLPADAVITNGAGNYAGWVNRYYRYRAYRSLLGPTSGSMGYGLPAAVAAKLAAPERAVVCFAGDGCFQMTCQEFGTAVQHGAAIVVIIANNGSYGTIRMHQEREYPGRVSGTRLVNPDFAAFARAYGGHGETVERTEDFAAAFERAQASGKPAIIDLKTDPDALAPRLTLSGLTKRK